MLIVLLLLVGGVKYRRESTDDWFSRENCVALKGIMAMYIVLVHIRALSSFSSPWVWVLYPAPYAMILSNGFFFFTSGWGLMESKKYKQGYLTGKSLIHRLLTLLIPIYCLYIVYYFMRGLFGNKSVSLVSYIFGGQGVEFLYFDDVLWFVIELCFLYLFFWGLYGRLSDKKADIMLGMIMAGWIAWALYSARGIVWYASTYCFLFGILFSQYREHLARVIKEKYRICLIGTIMGFVVFFVMYIITYDNIRIGNAIIANCATVLFCVMCFLLLYRYEVKSKCTLWLGKISYELYLCHMMVNKVCTELINNEVLRIYSVVVLSIISAFVIYWSDCKVNQYIKLIVKKIR